MSLAINDFISKFTGGGYRPNLYRVTLPTYADHGDTTQQIMMCKSTSVPPSTLGSPDISYMGRKIKVAGDRDYPSWTTDFYEDTNMFNRAYFEDWHQKLNDPVSNVAGDTINPNVYLGDIKFELLDRQENVLRTYTLVQAYPSEVGELSVGYDNNDSIGEFSVTWEFQYWTPS